MATAALPHVSIEEYLHSVYSPDVDYVDGILEERNLGEFDHADLQSELLTLLRNRSGEWQVRVVAEARVQVSPTRFRVPDVCVMPLQWQRTQIIHEAPMLCIEVLSPEDRLPRVVARCREFLAMGTPEAWIFDPAKRVAHRVTNVALTEHRDGVLSLSGTPLQIDLPSVFQVLDR